jgi:hypothetical protein
MSSSISFPTIRATINLDMQPANVLDMNMLWLRAASGPVAILAQAVPDASDTALVFSSPAQKSIVGGTLLIDQEPVSVTALSDDGLTATVVRYATAFPFMSSLPVQPSSAHAAGAGAMQLLYDTPWEYITYKYLLPQFQAEVNGLGKLAVTFGTVSSGSLSVNSGS